MLQDQADRRCTIVSSSFRILLITSVASTPQKSHQRDISEVSPHSRGNTTCGCKGDVHSGHNREVSGEASHVGVGLHGTITGLLVRETSDPLLSIHPAFRGRRDDGSHPAHDHDGSIISTSTKTTLRDRRPAISQATPTRDASDRSNPPNSNINDSRYHQAVEEHRKRNNRLEDEGERKAQQDVGTAGNATHKRDASGSSVTSKQGLHERRGYGVPRLHIQEASKLVDANKIPAGSASPVGFRAALPAGECRHSLNSF
ncbi:hypothetical protein BCR34DRAFT_74496 [Clohesyomyces aquaticus]|uniref:Uncharacterized protein n=1 Tax=Clohesyomyces aquaticus TaxID=1231657 RepID=A0A1Y2A370_9PLEO|nr:hypothetical protein BCR34DRAFT_74496 [Clohesyomyces aquaticus]